MKKIEVEEYLKNIDRNFGEDEEKDIIANNIIRIRYDFYYFSGSGDSEIVAFRNYGRLIATIGLKEINNLY